LKKFIYFLFFGFLGTLVNLTVFYFAYNFTFFSYTCSSILAFFFAVTSNYILNSLWTFSKKGSKNKLNILLFIPYILCNLTGLALNLLILNFIVYFLGVNFYFIGQIIGIFFAAFLNFFLLKKFVYQTSA
jgi:putative flippase GtrA